MKLDGKTIVITGAGAPNGIGAALARRFKAAGAANLYLADIDEAGVKAVAEEVGGIGMGCDVTDEAQVKALIERAENETAGIDLMCSNAGIALMDGPNAGVEGSSNEDWERAWQVNLMAHVYAARACLPGMIGRGGGYFLHTASAAGLLSQIGSATYSVTKHAAVGFGESLAIAHGHQGIKVSLLCPQGVVTNMTAGASGDKDAAAADGMITPEELADCVVQGIDDESFLILPHPQVKDYMQGKTADYDRWIGGMIRFRNKLAGG
ncbi:MAG: SDR family oxidoreductase [Alphaproteobacteria bacterium]